MSALDPPCECGIPKEQHDDRNGVCPLRLGNYSPAQFKPDDVCLRLWERDPPAWMNAVSHRWNLLIRIERHHVTNQWYSTQRAALRDARHILQRWGITLPSKAYKEGRHGQLRRRPEPFQTQQRLTAAIKYAPKYTELMDALVEEAGKRVGAQNPGPNPSGLCMCGCGEKTNIAPNDRARDGWVKGTPVKYVKGHAGRKTRGGRELHGLPGWREMDTPCWVWTGRVRQSDGRPMWSDRLAYRRVYEEQRGSVPPEDMHHRCENPLCVNPDHLEPMKHDDHQRHHGKT